MELVPYIITGATALVSGGGLTALLLKRRWAKEDARENVHVTVESKKIDQDSHAFDHVMKRLESVEQQLTALQKDHSTEMAANSRCQAEAEALRKDNERQQGEIERLRARVHELAEKIQIKDGQILSFQSSLEDLKRRFEVLTAERQHDIEELNRLKKASV